MNEIDNKDLFIPARIEKKIGKKEFSQIVITTSLISFIALIIITFQTQTIQFVLSLMVGVIMGSAIISYGFFSRGTGNISIYMFIKMWLFFVFKAQKNYKFKLHNEWRK
ncbi:MAG: hypothetical protein RSA79_00085 [Oscillospiraceae bacterium]